MKLRLSKCHLGLLLIFCWINNQLVHLQMSGLMVKIFAHLFVDSLEVLGYNLNSSTHQWCYTAIETILSIQKKIGIGLQNITICTVMVICTYCLDLYEICLQLTKSDILKVGLKQAIHLIWFNERTLNSNCRTSFQCLFKNGC